MLKASTQACSLVHVVIAIFRLHDPTCFLYLPRALRRQSIAICCGRVHGESLVRENMSNRRLRPRTLL